MPKNSLIFAALLGVFGLVACDEGDILEQNEGERTSGKTARLTAIVTGMDTWSSPYSVVLAGFAEGGSNVLVQKQLASAVAADATSGAVSTTLALTSDDIATIELCVTNRLRERIVTFVSVSATQATGDTIRLDAGTVDLSMYKSIQDLVFTGTCARCHGLGATPAGGLSLVEGQSYAQLVGQASRLPERGIRVVPGNASQSLLHKVIHGDPTAGVTFDHSNMIKEATTVALIDNWINSGAKE